MGIFDIVLDWPPSDESKHKKRKPTRGRTRRDQSLVDNGLVIEELLSQAAPDESLLPPGTAGPLMPPPLEGQGAGSIEQLLGGGGTPQSPPLGAEPNPLAAQPQSQPMALMDAAQRRLLEEEEMKRKRGPISPLAQGF